MITRQFHKEAGGLVSLLVVGIALCLQPWWLPFDLGSYDYARWVETGFLSLLPVIALLFRHHSASESIDRHLLPLTIFMLLSAIVCALSTLGWLSWVEGVRGFLWMTALVLLVDGYGQMTDRGRRTMATCLISILFIHLLYTFLGFLTLILNQVSGIQYMVSGFATYNYAGGFYALCFLLLPGLHGLANPKRRVFFLCSCLTGIFLAFFILMIRARGSLLGIFVALSLIAFLGYGKSVRQYWKNIIIYAVGGFFLFLFVQAFEITLSGLELGSAAKLVSDSGRFILWDAAWQGFLSSPFFGNGPLSYSLNVDLANAHPHNLVLSLLYEYGGIFVMFALIMVGRILLKLFKCRVEIGSDLHSISGFAAVTAFVVHVQFSGLSMIPATVMIFATGLMLCFEPVLGVESRLPLASHIKKIRLLVLPIIIAATLYPVLVCGYWVASPGRTVAEPRFWLEGEIVSPPPWPFNLKPDNHPLIGHKKRVIDSAR